MRLGRWSFLALGVAAAACASTIGPVVPSIQVLVVLDSLDDTLRIIPVDSPFVVHKLVLNVAAFSRHALAVRGTTVEIGATGFAYSFDIGYPQRNVCRFDSKSPSPIAALAFDDGGNVFAAQPASNNVPHYNPSTCGSGEATIRGKPSAFASIRGTLFAIASNAVSCDPSSSSCPEAPSWLSANPQNSQDGTRALVLRDDSIPLSLPGNAQAAVSTADGFLYVLNAGNGRQQNARLSQVDPVDKSEHNVYNGFGTRPEYMTTDGNRIFVASALEGLMVYNTTTRVLEHDANAAIPLFGGKPHGLAVDDVGRLYVVIAGGCGPGGLGSVRVYGADLVSKSVVNVGTCPVAIGVTDIPATLYRFDH
jgi:hypothetical protein